MHRHGFANQVILVILCGLALIAAPTARFLLPERFLRDDASLQVAMNPQTALLTDSSFRAVAEVYTSLGLEHAAPLAGLLNMTLFVVCMVAAVGWERVRDARPIELAAIALCLVVGLAYLGQFSKELVTLAIGALVLMGPRRRIGDVLIVLACLAYGAIRPYWFLVAAIYIIWRLVLPRTRNWLLLLLVPVVVFAVLQPVFAVELGGGLQSQRSGVNAIREGLDSVETMIVSPLPDVAGPVGIAAALLMLLLLIVPVSLFMTLSPFHVASALLITAIWLCVLTPILRGNLLAQRGTAPARALIVAGRAAALLLALVTTQALFEPDYGSYLKHLTPLLPLALALTPPSLRTLEAHVPRRASAHPDVPSPARRETA